MTPTTTAVTAGGEVINHKILIRYVPMQDIDTVEAWSRPEDAIRRLKEIRHRRYEAIASIDRQIESIEAFL